MTEFQTRALIELAEIRRLLSRLAPDDPEADLLREICRVVPRETIFTAREVTARAELDSGLQAVLVTVVGAEQSTRKLGWLLRKLEGKTLAGASVVRVGDVAGEGAQWKVSTAKLGLPIDHSSDGSDYARITRAGRAHASET